MRPLWLLATAAALQAAPVITSVVNAASHLPAELPNSGLARGALISIEGSDLGPADSLAVRVTFAAGSADCELVSAGATRVTAILPLAAPSGDAKMVLSRGGESSEAFDIRVVDAAFGIFTRNEAGSGPAIAQVDDGSPDPPPNSLTQPARTGQTMILWGTGLGPADEAGEIATAVEVFVAGKPAAVVAKRRAPATPGVDQVVFTVPAGVAGCHLPVAVRAGGIVGNFATISVDDTGRSCSDPNGASADDLDFLRASGSLAFGHVDVTRLSFGPVFADYAEALFARGNLAGWSAEPSSRSLPAGSCIVQWERDGVDSPDGRVEEGLDAGPAVSVTVGSNSRPLLARFGAPGHYSADLNRFLEPGPVTIDNADGGAQVKRFRVTVNVPAGIQWTNADALASVSRDRDLEITWSGGVVDRETALIYGVVPAAGRVTAGFSCAASVAEGKFSVPSWVMAALPPGAGTGVLGVGVANVSGVRFNADGIRSGIATAANLTARNAVYR